MASKWAQETSNYYDYISGNTFILIVQDSYELNTESIIYFQAAVLIAFTLLGGTDAKR